MATAWKTVRIFISSTFRDVQAKRDHLVKFIFPHLRKLWMRKSITCNFKLEPQCMEFLTRHARVHLKQDWSMLRADPRHSFSARYALAYSALKEFALAGTLSVFNGAIGPIALLSSETSRGTLKCLCDLITSETGESFPLDQIHVEAFEIANGSCVVITLPPPQVLGEAYMVGIVTDASLEKPTSEKPSKQATVHYFSLELSQGGPPVLCGWQLLGGRSRKNYEIRLSPQVGAFVDGIERLWVSGNWKF